MCWFPNASPEIIVILSCGFKLGVSLPLGRFIFHYVNLLIVNAFCKVRNVLRRASLLPGEGEALNISRNPLYQLLVCLTMSRDLSDVVDALMEI